MTDIQKMLEQAKLLKQQLNQLYSVNPEVKKLERQDYLQGLNEWRKKAHSLFKALEAKNKVAEAWELVK